ncbi:Beta-1,3-glucan-binding protein [Eumeta japonica]|uniref:Beta-1,3-glucan-binding protein n=1 Tax=Eumeta variegata TaxID=151549 RepID=A0A4C1T2N8_EUMVA|nr:Beta-1,3-glucan-binding protein [Eumeta japonica]
MEHRTFTFNAKINSQFEQLENGTFSGDIYGPDGNNQWTHENPNAELQLGDILYYWFTCKKNGRSFTTDRLYYAIKNDDVSAIAADILPTLTVKAYSNGFQVSISHKMVWNILGSMPNSQLQENECGLFSGFVNEPDGIPTPTIKIYSKGFEVSIPHEEGIECFRFDAAVDSAVMPNKDELKANERGTISGRINAPGKNKLFTFSDFHAKLNCGDVLHYRISERINGKIISRGNCYRIVKKIMKMPVRHLDTKTVSSTEVHPKGLRICIPHEEGVDYFRVDANVNSELREHERGTLSDNIYERDENGQWTYLNLSAELKPGDTLCTGLVKA